LLAATPRHDNAAARTFTADRVQTIRSPRRPAASEG